MYLEVPIQNRVVERRFVQQENQRHKNVLNSIMQAPAQPKLRSMSTNRSCSRKNHVAYLRHIEIETDNRKLLDSMSRIMHSKYKSPVKTAIANPPRKILSLNARAKKENLQRIAHDNQQMLNRLINGKSTFSVQDWEKQHQKRQKLLQKFGVHPYVLNQKTKAIDPNQTYLSGGGVWQSSTKIGPEDNASKFNFPLGMNYPSQISTGLSNTGQSVTIRDSLTKPNNNQRQFGSSSNASPVGGGGSFWPNQATSSQNNQHRGEQNNHQTLTQSLFFDKSSINQKQQLTPKKRNMATSFQSYQYTSSMEPSIMSQPQLGQQTMGSPRATVRKLTESRTIVNRQASILDENRVVLYKKGKRMGMGFYIVEISSCHTQLFITAFNVEKPQSLILEIPERRARYILAQFDHDIEQMAASLTVTNNNQKLVLLNPHFRGGAATMRHQRAFSGPAVGRNQQAAVNFSSSAECGLNNTIQQLDQHQPQLFEPKTTLGGYRTASGPRPEINQQFDSVDDEEDDDTDPISAGTQIIEANHKDERNVKTSHGAFQGIIMPSSTGTPQTANQAIDDDPQAILVTADAQVDDNNRQQQQLHQLHAHPSTKNNRGDTSSGGHCNNDTTSRRSGGVYHRPWRGGKAQSVGHISAGGGVGAGGRRHAAGGFVGGAMKPQTSRAIATAATGVDSLGHGSSGTGELGRTITNEAPDGSSSIKEQAQSYYHSKLTQQQAKSLTATAAANKTVIENKSKSPKALNGKVKLRSAGHNLFRPPANKPTFQQQKTTTTNSKQQSVATREDQKSTSPARGAVLKTAKTAVSYRLKKQPLAYQIAASATASKEKSAQLEERRQNAAILSNKSKSPGSTTKQAILVSSTSKKNSPAKNTTSTAQKTQPKKATASKVAVSQKINAASAPPQQQQQQGANNNQATQFRHSVKIEEEQKKLSAENDSLELPQTERIDVVANNEQNVAVQKKIPQAEPSDQAKEFNTTEEQTLAETKPKDRKSDIAQSQSNSAREKSDDKVATKPEEESKNNSELLEIEKQTQAEGSKTPQEVVEAEMKQSAKQKADEVRPAEVVQQPEVKKDNDADKSAPVAVKNNKDKSSQDSDNYEDDEDNFQPETPITNETKKVAVQAQGKGPPQNNDEDKDSYSEACEEDKNCNEDDDEYPEDEFDEDVKADSSEITPPNQDSQTTRTISQNQVKGQISQDDGTLVISPPLTATSDADDAAGFTRVQTMQDGSKARRRCATPLLAEEDEESRIDNRVATHKPDTPLSNTQQKIYRGGENQSSGDIIIDQISSSDKNQRAARLINKEGDEDDIADEVDDEKIQVKSCE